MTLLLERTVERLYRYRLTILMLLHAALIVMANRLAFWLRFDGPVPPEQRPYDTTLLPLLLLVRLAIFFPLRLHEGVWRYASIWDLRNIVGGVTASSLLFWAITHGALGIRVYPRSVFIIDAVLLICLMGGVRLSRRLYAASSRRDDARRVLIYGAGDAGEMIARDMLVRRVSQAVPVGFLDDDPAKRGLKIHGLPVVGGGDRTADAIERLRPDEILIAIPSAEPRSLRRILSALASCALPIKTLPRLREVNSGEITLNEIRDLSVTDLLARPPVGLDPSRVLGLIHGRTVLVTGAGGSIGAELCRQILVANPARLVLLERYENSLFSIHAELRAHVAAGALVPIVGDITDAHRVEQIFSAERPQVVFHAAAHKHVPLMESNPSEAVKNNVRGTRLLTEAALRWGTTHFVLISSDKAVNPTSVMGATKHLAERIVERCSTAGKARFTSVRFGNVLGSNGSVVPTFLDQIKAGGPVTVTHPDMRRYFMLISEAVQLVLHAAALGGQGGIYVLDMGEQIHVLDMARDLIRLAGYVPDHDIEIVFTGIRPGEKMFEELVGVDEYDEPSEVDKVRLVHRSHEPRDGELAAAIETLERLACEDDAAAVTRMLRQLVQTLGRAQRPPRTAAIG